MGERSGIVTSQGVPLTLIGRDLRVGDRIPEFTVLAPDLSPVSSRELHGKIVVYNVVPSLDTEVCYAQTKRFNQELAALPAGVHLVTLSADLPFAQARFTREERINHRLLSDHRDFSFAQAFGVGIKELRLLARAIFVVNAEGRVTYREIVPDLSSYPDYGAALQAARAAASD